MKKIISLLIVIVVLALVGCTINPFAKVEDRKGACTMEAKICPDGSAVGRQGPNCEFAPCPTNPNRTPGQQNNSCYTTKECPNGQNCYIINRYNYRTHQQENVYSECIARCDEQQKCPNNIKCGIFTVQNTVPNLVSTADWLCISEQKNNDIQSSLKNIERFYDKRINFNGSVLQGKTAEFQYSTTKNPLELELLLSYAQIGNEDIAMTVFDPQGRYIGEDFGGGLIELQNKSKIPDAEYGKSDLPKIIFIKNPMSGTYIIKIWGVVVPQNGSGTGEFSILGDEHSAE